MGAAAARGELFAAGDRLRAARRRKPAAAELGLRPAPSGPTATSGWSPSTGWCVSTGCARRSSTAPPIPSCRPPGCPRWLDDPATGTLWIGTEDGRLIALRGDPLRQLTASAARLALGPVTALQLGPDGRLFVFHHLGRRRGGARWAGAAAAGGRQPSPAASDYACGAALLGDDGQLVAGRRRTASIPRRCRRSSVRRPTARPASATPAAASGCARPPACCGRSNGPQMARDAARAAAAAGGHPLRRGPGRQPLGQAGRGAADRPARLRRAAAGATARRTAWIPRAR